MDLHRPFGCRPLSPTEAPWTRLGSPWEMGVLSRSTILTCGYALSRLRSYHVKTRQRSDQSQHPISPIPRPPPGHGGPSSIATGVGERLGQIRAGTPPHSPSARWIVVCSIWPPDPSVGLKCLYHLDSEIVIPRTLVPHGV
jgi:hypothetical protein